MRLPAPERSGYKPLQYQQVLGDWGPSGGGLIGSELNAPLIGIGTDGNPLIQAQASAQQLYFDYVSPGACGES
jgi:hypothetical protein